MEHLEYKDFEVLKESLIRLIQQAIINSESATKYAYDFEENHRNKELALAFLQKANSKMAAAEALYYSQIFELLRSEIEDIFHLFDVFSNELMNNCCTNHSHQWSDIEYQNLRDLFDRSVCAFENNVKLD